RNQYLTEYIVGGEQQVLPDISVGIKGIYRSYGQVIEDYLCGTDGTYCIGNPGEGIMQRLLTLNYVNEDPKNPTTLPAPKPKRIYKGIQLDANKRFSN